VANDPKFSIESAAPVGRYAVGVKWRDGHESIFPFANLRRSCPCNDCRESGCSERKPSSQEQQFIGLLQVADASVLFRWGDSHETLYLVEELRDLCSCAACKGEPNYPITGQ
jgi:DUF971 family protein